MPQQSRIKIFHSNIQTEISIETVSIKLVQILGARKGKLAAQLNQVTKKKKRRSKERRSISWLKIRGCLVCVFKQLFSVFKQHFTYFNALFHPHEFSQMFSNNNIQFLNICTKWTLTLVDTFRLVFFFFLTFKFFF